MEPRLKGLGFLKFVSILYLGFASLMVIALYEESRIITIIAYIIIIITLLTAGLHGLTTVKKSLRNQPNLKHFQDLAWLHTFLGIFATADLMSCGFGLVSITTGFYPTYGNEMLRLTQRYHNNSKAMATDIYIAATVIALAAVVMTFAAAWISRLNIRILVAHPHNHALQMDHVQADEQNVGVNAEADLPPAYDKLSLQEPPPYEKLIPQGPSAV